VFTIGSRTHNFYSHVRKIGSYRNMTRIFQIADSNFQGL